MSNLYENYVTEHAGAESVPDLVRVLDRDLFPWVADKDARCLDLGCGQGGLSQLMRDAGIGNSFGVDISPEQVARAHELGRDFVKLGDLANVLSGEAGCWDVITAFDLLEHLERDAVVATFGDVQRALAPGGLFIVRVPNGAGPLSGEIQYGDFTHLSIFTGRSLRQLANRAGFSRVEVREAKPVVHSARSAIRRAIWASFSGLTKLSLAAETGRVRGHLVTSNIMAYLHK